MQQDTNKNKKTTCKEGSDTTRPNGDEQREMFHIVPSQVKSERCGATRATSYHKGITIFPGEHTTKVCPFLH
jgi:hypothetical protein